MDNRKGLSLRDPPLRADLSSYVGSAVKCRFYLLKGENNDIIILYLVNSIERVKQGKRRFCAYIWIREALWMVFNALQLTEAF